jgi:predicted urease superfamily metal-dependent hydrolase
MTTEPGEMAAELNALNESLGPMHPEEIAGLLHRAIVAEHQRDDLRAALDLAHRYIAKAVADGELQGCVIPVENVERRIAALLAKIDGKG